MRYLMLFLLLAIAVYMLSPATLDAAPRCANGQCTLEAPAVAVVVAPARAVVGTARRSAATVGRVAVRIAVKPVAVVVKAKPIRSSLKGIAKLRPLSRVANGMQLLCPLRRRCE